MPVPSVSLDRPAFAVTDSGAVPDIGVTCNAASGLRSVVPAGASYAPRSSYPAGPLATLGSSYRAVPARSVACSPETVPSAESIAGEPAVSVKTPESGLAQRGSDRMPWASCPVAERNADSEP